MLKYEVMAVNSLWRWKEHAKGMVHDFFVDEEGDTNLISIVVVLVIVMALAVVFRKNIAEIVTKMWKQIGTDAGSATGTSINTEGFQ